VVPLDLEEACQHIPNQKRHINTHSHLVTTIDSNGSGSLDVGYVAFHSRRGDINHGVVVGRSINVSTLNISGTLRLSAHRNAVDGGVSAG